MSTSLDSDDDYPRAWEADVVLRDGSAMYVRPIVPSDAEALQALHLSQSEQSVYFRFFTAMDRLSDQDLHRFTHVDHRDRVALVLVSGPDIHAVGRFDVVEPGVAEVAFYVTDEDHGRGLGSILLEHLAAAGRELGIKTFLADVLVANSKMVRVFAEAGYAVSTSVEDGIILVEMSLRQTGKSWQVLAEREHRAEAQSMRALAAAPAVIAAALDETGSDIIGRVVARARTAHNHPRIDHLTPEQGSVPWDRVGNDPAPTVAVVAGRPQAVIDAIPHLKEAGAGAVVVLSGGFGEVGHMELQLDLLRATRLAGIRVVGPLSYGIHGHGPHGTYDLTRTEAGVQFDTLSGAKKLGIFSQSAEAAHAMRSATAARYLAETSLVSAGNRIDVSGNDVMQTWLTNDDVGVGVVHLETIGNPRKFSRIARRLAATRPLIVLTSPTTGRALLPGHAVRTTHQRAQVLDQMLDQAGAIRVGSVRQCADMAALASSQPLNPITTVAMGASSVALAAILEANVRAAGLSPAGEVIIIDSTQAVDNLAATNADAVAVSMSNIEGPVDPELLAAVARANAHDSERPWAGWIQGMRGLAPELRADDAALPCLDTIAEATAALAQVSRYATWKEHADEPVVEPPDIDAPAARELLIPWQQPSDSFEEVDLPRDEVQQLLAAYGINLLPSTRIDGTDAEVAEAAVQWAHNHDGAVVLKAEASALRHRTDLGGVHLDLRDAEEVRLAALRLRQRGREVLGRDVALDIQAMASQGVACVVTTSEDPLFGPVISFGLGGDAHDFLDDISVRIAPVNAIDVATMVRSVRAAPRLMGNTGLPPVDLTALETLLSRCAALADEQPSISRLSLNPVIATPTGLTVAGARAAVAAPRRQDTGRRVLPTPAGDVT